MSLPLGCQRWRPWKVEFARGTSAPGRKAMPQGQTWRMGSGTSRAIIPLKPKEGLNGAPSICCRCGKSVVLTQRLRPDVVGSQRPKRQAAEKGPLRGEIVPQWLFIASDLYGLRAVPLKNSARAGKQKPQGANARCGEVALVRGVVYGPTKVVP
jgi:hypothetical protein